MAVKYNIRLRRRYPSLVFLFCSIICICWILHQFLTKQPRKSKSKQEILLEALQRIQNLTEYFNSTEKKYSYDYKHAFPILGKRDEIKAGVQVRRKPIGKVTRLCKVYNFSEKAKMIEQQKFSCSKITDQMDASYCIPFRHGKLKLLTSKPVVQLRVVQLLEYLLKTDNHLGLVDIGAGVGAYSLTALSLDHPVVAVEPVTPSILAFHRGLQLTATGGHLILLQNAIADRRGIMRMVYESNDFLQASLQPIDDAPGSRNDTMEEYTRVIHLDDVTSWCKFRNAILKMDSLMGNQTAYFYSNVFFDSIFVKYVIMDWSESKQSAKLKIKNSVENVEVLIAYLCNMQYLPYGVAGETGGYSPLARDSWPDWPDNVLWVGPGASVPT